MKKVWKGLLIALVCVCVLLAGSMLAFFGIDASIQKKYDLAPFEEGSHGDRIHFIDVGHSDAILLESNGKYAMVDAGEDTDNPRGFSGLALQGYEDDVLATIKKIAGDENGRVHLEFVVGTHAHSDHIGGFDTVIRDEDITVGKAYLKAYDESAITRNEVDDWDNREVYDQMVQACSDRGVEVVSALPDAPFAFENLTVQLKNTQHTKSAAAVGENENSLGVYLMRDGVSAFLAGDINDLDGDESRISTEIGKINLLKLGHHGYANSSMPENLRRLHPDVAIVTNKRSMVNLKSRLCLMGLRCPTYGVVDKGGIVAEFSEDGFVLYRSA